MNIVFYAAGNRRARTLYGAFAQGLARHGLNLGVMHADNYSGIQADIAVFYGLAGNLKQLMRDYLAAGKTTIFFDLGYWGRHDSGRYTGYHRVVVNGLHTKLGEKRYPRTRLKQFDIKISSSPPAGDCIVLAGQSAKAAWVYDLQPEEWEKAAVARIRRQSSLPIYYHPKNSWRDARPLDETIYWPGPIDELLERAWALVTHHSNSSLLALARGVPVFMTDGIAKCCALENLDLITEPRYPTMEEVENLLAGAACWQWRVDEIARGGLWEFLRSEGVA